MTAGLPLLESVLTQLAKSVLSPLGLSANYRIRNYNINNFNEEMEDIMKIVKSLEESGLLVKGISETIK